MQHQAEVLADQWRLTFNHKRPHGVLNYLTPAAYAGTTMDDSLINR